MKRPSTTLLAAACLPLVAIACGPSAVAPVAPNASATPVVEPVIASAAPSTPESAAPLACLESGAPRPRVVNLDDPWPSQSFTPALTDMTPAVKKACEAIEKRRAKAEKEGPGQADAGIADLGRCFGSHKGAWALDTSDPKKLPPDARNGDGWQVHYKLTYVAPDGHLHTSSQIEGDAQGQDVESHGVEVLGLFDYDNDGVSEILVRTWSDYGGEEHDSSVALMTFKDGELGPYTRAEKIDITEMLDVDFDGRPDLVIPGSMSTIGPCGLDGQTFSSPAQIAHSLPDGTFALNDAVTQEIVRSECGPLARDLVAIDRSDGSSSLDPTDTARRVACARIYGMPAKQAQGRVRERYPYPVKDKDKDPEPGDPGYCMSLKMLLDLAGQSPTVSADPPCAAK